MRHPERSRRVHLSFCPARVARPSGGFLRLGWQVQTCLDLSKHISPGGPPFGWVSAILTICRQQMASFPDFVRGRRPRLPGPTKMASFPDFLCRQVSLPDGSRTIHPEMASFPDFYISDLPPVVFLQQPGGLQPVFSISTLVSNQVQSGSVLVRGISDRRTSHQISQKKTPVLNRGRLPRRAKPSRRLSLTGG
jgi:hypothetical protein